jgi:hypothetical protein
MSTWRHIIRRATHQSRAHNESFISHANWTSGIETLKKKKSLDGFIY